MNLKTSLFTFLWYFTLYVSRNDVVFCVQEENIEQVRVGIKAKLPTPELAQLLISALDQLVEDCKYVHHVSYLFPTKIYFTQNCSF